MLSKYTKDTFASEETTIRSIMSNRAYVLSMPSDIRYTALYRKTEAHDQEMKRYAREWMHTDYLKLKAEWRLQNIVTNTGALSVAEAVKALAALRKESPSYKDKNLCGTLYNVLMIVDNGAVKFDLTENRAKYDPDTVYQIRGSDLYNTGIYSGILNVEKACDTDIMTVSAHDNIITLKAGRVTYRIYTFV